MKNYKQRFHSEQRKEKSILQERMYSLFFCSGSKKNEKEDQPEKLQEKKEPWNCVRAQHFEKQLLTKKIQHQPGINPNRGKRLVTLLLAIQGNMAYKQLALQEIFRETDIKHWNMPQTFILPCSSHNKQYVVNTKLQNFHP